MTLKDESQQEETVAINITHEVYLHGRDEPVNVNATFEIAKSVLTDGDPLENMMNVALNYALSAFDVVGAHRLVYSDERFNKYMFLVEEVQGVSILAPDELTLQGLLEE